MAEPKIVNNYRAEIERNNGLLHAQKAKLQGMLEALSHSDDFAETLRADAWLRAARHKVTGSTWADIKMPNGWPPGHTLEAALEAHLGPIIARMDKSGNGSGDDFQVVSDVMKKFREAVG